MIDYRKLTDEEVSAIVDQVATHEELTLDAVDALLRERYAEREAERRRVEYVDMTCIGDTFTRVVRVR